jgi:hypothetical protein
MSRFQPWALICWVPAALGLLLTAGAPAPGQPGQPAPTKPKELQWTHAFDLACRKNGEDKFGKDTQKFGVEAFKDNNNGLGLYVCQTGSIALGHGFATLKAPLPKAAGPKWLTGLDLPARRAGEKVFTKDTKVHSMEVFLDPNTDNWLYITEKGNIASSPARSKASGASAAPKWVHSVDLSVRKGGIKEWRGAAKFGVEVYRDSNTGNLIYICETGAIAVSPESAPVKSDAKAPDWLHGLDLSCRKHDEKAFTSATRKFGVEVFHDIVTGHYLLICETGAIAVAPAPADVKAPTVNVKEPRWTHGLNVKARKYGEKDFSDKTQVFGAEVFRDDNIGVTIYVCETGAIAATLTK